MLSITEKNAVLENGKLLVDFELDAFANLEISAKLDGETELEIVLGEVLDANGKIERNPGGYRTIRQMVKKCPAGESVFEFDISPHQTPYKWNTAISVPQEMQGEVVPFRYVEISGKDVSGSFRFKRRELFGPCRDDQAHFESSDAFLNRLWEFCKYTMKATSGFGFFIDGERERLPYEGDSYINQLGYFCCCTDREVPRRTIDWLLQNPTWPTEWRLIMPQVVLDYVLYTGDDSCVARWIPALKEALLPERRDADGLLRPLPRKAEKSTDLIDWPPEERDNYEHGEVNLVPNCYYYQALKNMEQLTGDVQYGKMAQQVKESIYRLFFDEKSGLFMDNSTSCHSALHSSVFPLFFNLADDPEPLKKQLLAHRIDCSVYVAQFLVESCFRAGLTNHAFSLLTGSDLRSWRNMLDKGATISMEAWDDSLKPNQDWNHAWGAAPANLIPRFIAGIRPTAPGFTEFVFDPHPGGLQEFFLKHPTPCGAITVKFSSGSFELTIPEGTCGIYCNRRLAPGKHVLQKI